MLSDSQVRVIAFPYLECFFLYYFLIWNVLLLPYLEHFPYDCLIWHVFYPPQITHESFLEDVNNILNSGEVPNLYELDEYEKVLNDARTPARQVGKVDNNDGGVCWGGTQKAACTEL